MKDAVLTSASVTDPIPTGSDTREDVRMVARGGGLNVVGAIANGALGFALVAIIARGLGSAGSAGAFFQAVALASIAVRLSQLGADIGLVKQIPSLFVLGRPNELRVILASAVVPVAVLGTSLGFAGYMLAPWIGATLGDGGFAAEATAYVRVFSVFLPVAVLFTLLAAMTRAFGTMKPSVVLDSVTRPALQVVLVAAVFVLGGGPIVLGTAYWLPAAVGAVALLVWLLRFARRLPAPESGSTPPHPRRWTVVSAEFWRFSLPRAAAGFFSVVIQWLDTLLLGALAGAAAAGIYATTTRYLLVGTAVQMALTNALQPRIAALLVAGEHDRAEGVFQTVSGWSVAMTWPLYCSIAVWAPNLLRLFGEDFVAGAPAVRILAMGWLLATALGPVDSVLLMGGKSAWSMGNLGAALVVNVGLNFLLIPRLGLTGAALAWTASILTHNLLPLWQVSRFLGLSPFGSGVRVGAPLAAVIFGAGSLALRGLFGTTLPAMAFSLVILGALYVGGLYLARSQLGVTELLSTLKQRVRPAT